MPVLRSSFNRPLTLRVRDVEFEHWRQQIPWIVRWLWKPRYKTVTFEEYFMERAKERRLKNGGTSRKEAQ